MTTPVEIRFVETALEPIAEAAGRVVVFLPESGKLDQAARRVNRLTRGALERFAESAAFNEMKAGQARELSWPSGMAAEAVLVVKLDRRTDAVAARQAGAAIGKAKDAKPMLVLAGGLQRAADVAFGLALRAYDFAEHKTGERAAQAPVSFMVSKPEETARQARDMAARAEGVFFTRDLVNTPSNILTTDDFAARLAAMQELGLDVEILEEAELKKLGMRTLLAVGQGSESPSKVVVMRWSGGAKDAAPLALVGKGVVFDTGGVSLKPAAGMEDMTMDMGGAGVVAGVMRTLALRKAKANVVGLVGLVENMPDGRAMRPGDVVTSMKGDTVEIINTDAEGRLVLADVLWYAQQRFSPAAMIDLATLTGAVIIALGHQKAGVFANDDALAEAVLRAAGGEDEGAWRLPLDPEYEKLLKSRVADLKNVGDRSAGAITAAQFLKRFVQDGCPWVHLDIAGVASTKSDTTYAPKGATGWGVLTLDRLVRDRFEG